MGNILSENRPPGERASRRAPSPVSRHGEIGDQTEMIAGPNALDGLIKNSCARGNIHRLASMRPKEIDRAVERRKRFAATPAKHTYEEI